MQIELSPWRFPVEWAEDVVSASASRTRCVLRYHVAEQAAGIDGVVLAYGYASDLLRAVGERIEDPTIRAGVVQHIKHGMLQALEQEVGADGLLVE